MIKLNYERFSKFIFFNSNGGMNCYLQFHGIPQTEKDLLSKVNAIATKIQLPQLSGDDVDAIHRLPSQQDKIPDVICCFAKQKNLGSVVGKQKKDHE